MCEGRPQTAEASTKLRKPQSASATAFMVVQVVESITVACEYAKSHFEDGATLKKWFRLGGPANSPIL